MYISKLNNLLDKLRFPRYSHDKQLLSVGGRLTFGLFVESKASIAANDRLAKIHLEQELLEDKAAAKALAEIEAYEIAEKIK